VDRRTFMRRSIGAAVTAGLIGPRATRAVRAAATEESQAPASQPASSLRSIRLGGPVFVKSNDPGQLALAHRKLGYRAAYCPGVSLDDSARIRDISNAFAKHDVVIAEVGRWCNLMDADPAKRAANLKTVTDGLALAEAIGARCCVDIAGSFNPDVWYGPHPDNLSKKFFDAAVENARKIIDAVKPRRAKLCYEMMGWAIPDSPDAYLKLIQAVNREAFGVHLDLCNLVNSPIRFYRNAVLAADCFDKLGPWIVSCHAKDLVWDVEMNVHFREVPAGSGRMDYTAYLRGLASLDHDAPLMIEHCANEAEYDKARKFILEHGEKIGVSFG
jgi:sugar phosphate isomerase/epimerase